MVRGFVVCVFGIVVITSVNFTTSTSTTPTSTSSIFATSTTSTPHNSFSSSTRYNFLVTLLPFPQTQLSTDDFDGVLFNATNLAMKGIASIAAYGYIVETYKVQRTLFLQRKNVTFRAGRHSRCRQGVLHRRRLRRRYDELFMVRRCRQQPLHDRLLWQSG
jgi:hypothetical protein